MVYVSKMELRGFKSFGNLKIELPLSSGLTAIVGPNGSGKSNIADALCFVLGEMSAKLMRATRFSDLMFNGGKGQRPAHFAEVSLYFDNGKGELPINSKTVVINRRVDQSGKCDYQINRKRASRQHIIDLLSVTMSSPEGYNFMMQGDVDRLIKIDSVSRRKMIDDLAGVAEYDEKREKSIAELQRVDTNLTNMRAILGEINLQLEKLRAEMQEADKHKELDEKLEEARGKLLHAQVRDHREKLLKLESNEDSLQTRIQGLKKKKEKIQQQFFVIQEEIKQVDDSILEKRSATTLMLAERLRERVRILEGFLTTTRAERATIEGEIATLGEKLKQVVSKKGTGEPSTEDVERFISKFEDLRKRFGSLYSKIEKGEFKALREMGEILVELGKVLEILSSKLSGFKHLLKEGPELKPSIERSGGEDPRTLSNRLLMLRSQLTPLASKKEEFETRLGEAKKALADVSSQEERERGLISRLQHRRTKLGPRRTSLEQKNSEFEQKLQELQSELQSVQLEKARLEIQLDSAEKGLRKLKREIQLSLVEKPGEIERNIISLEEQLQQMGPINFRALSDFKTTEDRHASERAKYDKLVGEKESIICAIEEIDRHKTEVFMHTFEKVSENFSQIFSELSPGGRAGLVLENPEHPLEGGLEIEANPAGKEITRIGAMSGGEKALTALAFIFALQRMKPTAIYVLDEIDAHLDDENLRRVAQMLKRLASNSQIIVVTLHEGMMAVADRLFGVSMDKVGVSHLFSVDLKGVGG